MMNCNDVSMAKLTLGHDLDKWYGFGQKSPINVDVSPSANSHMLICGMSGSGKSYCTQSVLAKMNRAEPDGVFWFADYKGEDSFSYLRGCPRYRSFKSSVEALDAVYDILMSRMSGEDSARYPVTLYWDEYIAGVLALIAEDKKAAATLMNKVSEILLLGRSMNVRFICSCQRPDALAFPAGSRLNYGVIVILGAVVRSIYEMLMPDFMEEVRGRQFGRGEGVVLLQGSELRFIKIPTVRNYERMQQLCIRALS